MINKIANQNYLEIKDKIIAFILSKTKEARVNGAIIGLSGGIDSTLTTYLATDALGSDNVLGILLPDDITPEQDIDDAMEIIKILGIDHRLIYTSNILQSFSSTIPDFDKGNLISNGNLKARMRMCILYYYANFMNRMIIGTGNKTELLLGYFTKYGDGGVDIEPIGGLYKTQVRGLSHYLGIPSRIIDKIPSAGLWPGQTDEGEIGITYDTIDRILSLLVDNKQDISVIKKKFPPRQVDMLARLILINEHKRTSIQSCILTEEQNKEQNKVLEI